MRMYVMLKTQVWIDPDTEEEVYFDTTKLDHPLVTHHDAVFGSYDHVAYFADVTITQALAIVDVLAGDPTIARFTPLLVYSL